MRMYMGEEKNDTYACFGGGVRKLLQYGIYRHFLISGVAFFSDVVFFVCAFSKFGRHRSERSERYEFYVWIEDEFNWCFGFTFLRYSSFSVSGPD